MLIMHISRACQNSTFGVIKSWSHLVNILLDRVAWKFGSVVSS